MSHTKLQEEKKKNDLIENNVKGISILKYSSKIANGFKFLLLPKSRFELLQIKDIRNLHRKKRKKMNGWLKSPFTIFGLILIFVIISLVIFGPWIAPYSYEEATRWSLNTWKPPSPEFPLGTTFAGQDVLSRAIYGVRTSILTAFLSVSISLIFGLFFGMVAGFYGKWVDSILMRCMDIILAFPGIIFALAFLAILGSRFSYIVIILGVIGIPFYSRLVRSSVLKEKELDYIAAAKISGANNWRIMFRHILPNAIQPIIISMSFDIGRLMISLVILSFLGFSDPRFINWGSDIYKARSHIWDAPWASFWPSVMILLSVIGFMIVGDGLRDALDPKYRNQK